MKKGCPRVHSKEEQLIEKRESKQRELELNDPKDQRKKYSVIHCFAVILPRCVHNLVSFLSFGTSLVLLSKLNIIFTLKIVVWLVLRLGQQSVLAEQP